MRKLGFVVGIGAFLLGGLVGLLQGWWFGEWLNAPRRQNPRILGVIGDLAIAGCFLLGCVALVMTPIWLRPPLRRR